jgi:transcriptional regulator with XRE-family HTH domain
MEKDLFKHVGARIRELRQGFSGGKGLSQEALGKELAVTANTISRWETATYHPSLRDLERISRFFGVSITSLLPSQRVTTDDKVHALLRAAKDLPDSDLEELRRFAEFRRARAIYPRGRPRPGRKPTSSS